MKMDTITVIFLICICNDDTIDTRPGDCLPQSLIVIMVMMLNMISIMITIMTTIMMKIKYSYLETASSSLSKRSSYLITCGSDSCKHDVEYDYDDDDDDDNDLDDDDDHEWN